MRGITPNFKQVSTTAYGLNSFSFEASKLWNNLSNIIKEKKDAENPDEFMFEINSWSGPKCINVFTYYGYGWQIYHEVFQDLRMAVWWHFLG